MSVLNRLYNRHAFACIYYILCIVYYIYVRMSEVITLSNCFALAYIYTYIYTHAYTHTYIHKNVYSNHGTVGEVTCALPLVRSDLKLLVYAALSY